MHHPKAPTLANSPTSVSPPNKIAEARLETLKAKFLKHGKLEKEADGCRRHDAELPDGLALPSILVELMPQGCTLG